MKCDAFLSALDLPATSQVNQRVPKKLLLENGAPTASDKRFINDGIEEIVWLAALKPTTIGVPEYRDDVREYLEIAVLRLALRPAAKAMRLVELMHRAIPYPLLLLTDQAEGPGLSVAHKRWSQGEVGKTVLDGPIAGMEWNSASDEKSWPAYRDSLALSRQPRATLYALYQGWMDTLSALLAARATGEFTISGNAADAASRRDALQEYARLDAEIVRLRAAAAKEKQLARQVELNLELKRIEVAMAATRAKL
jgi:hypothetical protein